MSRKPRPRSSRTPARHHPVILPFVQKEESQPDSLTWERLVQILSRCTNIEPIEIVREIARQLRQRGQQRASS